jgi:hypothetical protein
MTKLSSIIKSFSRPSLPPETEQTMDRFGILGRLQANWPGKYSMDRVQFLERELRKFSNEILMEGVTEVLRTAEFPPTVKVLHSACAKLVKQRERNSSGAKFHRPGDVIDGQRTLTPDEAREELVRVRKDFPEAFTLIPPDRHGGDATGTERLDIVVTRIYVKALQKCAALAPDQSVSISSPTTQTELF